jgi:hypothetical protein
LKQTRKRRGVRAVIDTSVVISGISAFKGSLTAGKSSSAAMLHAWVERGSFVWLVTAEILQTMRHR